MYIFMSREKKFNTKYSAEFEIAVVYGYAEEAFEYSQTVRKYRLGNPHNEVAKYILLRWMHICFEEGAAGLMTECRGRKSTNRPRKKSLDKCVENDLITEKQRLKERLEYLKMDNGKSENFFEWLKVKIFYGSKFETMN